MELTLLVALVAAAATALGWLVTYWFNRSLAMRKDHLDLVNRQLSDLYGPLYLSCKAGRAAYETLLSKVGRTKGIFDEESPPTDDEVREWFHWMKTVLGPINDRREELILKSSHLILEDQVPKCIVDFASHAAAYRALLSKWEQGDLSERYSTVPFPDELDNYAEVSFRKLKQEQARLLKRLHQPSSDG
jgi:hypothetical protein